MGVAGRKGRGAASGSRRVGARAPSDASWPVLHWFEPATRLFDRIRQGETIAVSQHVSFAAVGLLFAATAIVGINQGGHDRTFLENTAFAINSLARSAGLGMATVTITGLKELEEWQVLEALDIDETRSLLTFDVGEAREKLESVPWIRDASVLKLYPGTLRVAVVERDAYALWQRGGKLFVVDADGHVLEPYEKARFANLPLVVGERAAEAAPPLFAALDREPALRAKLRAAVLVSDRRWTLKLQDGTDVKLPEAGMEEALARLAELDRATGLLSRDVVSVDLRSRNRLVVRLGEGAAERWRVAAKEREKKKGANT